jgi:hypothetical protein
MNPYNVGVGGFVVNSLYVIILAFIWRALSARFAGSDTPTISNIGGAMGATL